MKIAVKIKLALHYVAKVIEKVLKILTLIIYE